MSWRDSLTRNLKSVREMRRDVEKLEQAQTTRIRTWVEKGEVYIEAPPLTFINCKCWVLDGTTVLDERIQMGTPEMIELLQIVEDLRDRIKRLEGKR